MSLTRGAFHELIALRSRRAEELGALVSFATNTQHIDDGGVRYVVRVAQNLARKHQADVAPRQDPFSPPYEEPLYVADLSPTHVVLLNKFNVFEHHALIVTQKFESQDTLLQEKDCDAMLRGLEAMDGLIFYNGGKTAGASQPHKHLQLVPTPLNGEGRTPMDAAIRNRALPFRCAVAELPWSASTALAKYRELLREVGREHDGAAYNLLATREFLMIVPRTRECFDDISINSLGFAGSLFVKDRAHLEKVREAKPSKILSHVTT